MNTSATETARKRYDRRAPVYDIMEALGERIFFHKWRRAQWGLVTGGKILEVGVGTGKNFPYYPSGADITAIDFSEKMLARARRKAARLSLKVRLLPMDVQHLEFEDNSFDAVLATFVFCSVPNPLDGLSEIKRVCKPGGKVVLLEHVLSANPLIARLMNLTNPIVVRAMGANINRQTVGNVARAGLAIEKVTDLKLGIFKLIQARRQMRADSGRLTWGNHRNSA